MPRSEIIYLLQQCIEKFQHETGQEMVFNTNKKNYEPLAIVLSEISNHLPETAEKLDHIAYTPDAKKDTTQYPFRKYDITGGQIRDAYMGLVANPRNFLVDACYIYLYGIGKQGFEKQPSDETLQKKLLQEENEEENLSVFQENERLKTALEQVAQNNASNKTAENKSWKRIAAIVSLLLIILSVVYYKEHQHNMHISKGMSLLPYKPTPAEIDSLQGIWICYTGSPQARISDPDRYHKMVANLMQITYLPEGFFRVERYGASFNHNGYAQFESKGLVSIHTHIKNLDQKIESPRHSLLSLHADSSLPYLNVISTSWNFDVGKFNQIIGIREVFQKLGNRGQLEEVYNSLENAQCKCKIIRWHQPNHPTQSWYLKNSPIDSLHNSYLSSMLDEKSILLKDPSAGILLDKK
ncbi:MAG: hypothetical protein EBX50_10885 [Chitinophagia bacterium]|nr:hypothetical protein [Chitinophagia bacterium]